MNRFTPFACFTHLALLLAGVGLPAASWAQHAPTASVDVRGKLESAPRVSLQQACAHALTDLPDALATTAQEVDSATEVAVRFELAGGRVHDLRTEGGNAKQARAVRRAVRNLGCDNGSAGRQSVQFLVRFVDPSNRLRTAATGGRVALLDTPAR